MTYDIYEGDLMGWAREYSGEPFHALLCDAPYELAFMGKSWDNTGISFDKATWAALAQHLYPGAFGFVFAGTRTYHRIACAIEDAGLIIHPMIVWAFGTGFPKATRIDAQADRMAGVEPLVVGERQHAPKFNAKAQGYREKDNGFNSRERTTFTETSPGSAMGQRWQGYRYGLQALKPALEPIIVFQRPYQGRAVDCITQTGAGALNIDGGRVPGWKPQVTQGVNTRATSFNVARTAQLSGDSNEGRWPSNLILLHTAACNGVCHPDCPVERMGAQSGESSSKATGYNWEGSVSNNPTHITANIKSGAHFDDTGTAARFFQQSNWMLDRLDAADPVRYVAKPSVGEREAGLEGWPSATVDDGRATPIDNAYLRGETERRNTHPTVKPIDLARYLATLLLPPPEYGPRRLLVPFAGSGTEMIGAGLAGWEHCQGIELEAPHVTIAEARLAWWIDVFGKAATV